RSRSLGEPHTIRTSEAFSDSISSPHTLNDFIDLASRRFMPVDKPFHGTLTTVVRVVHQRSLLKAVSRLKSRRLHRIIPWKKSWPDRLPHWRSSACRSDAGHPASRELPERGTA